MEPIPVVSPMRTVKAAGLIPAAGDGMRAAAALVFILAALFLYRTGQLYLERKALSREAQQWHRVQAGNTPAEPDGGVEYQGKSYRRNTYIKAILCMGMNRPGSLERRPGRQRGLADRRTAYSWWPRIRPGTG
ncbi:MAG: hypothetical protein ACLTBV_23760 [Enterocloster bolteae]